MGREQGRQGMNEERLRALFAAIDRKDTREFLSFLSPGARFRFANNPSCQGHAEIGAMVDGFFSAIRACRHELDRYWIQVDSAICHGLVTYTRLDGSVLTVPFANVMMLDGARISDYMIFVDVSKLFPAPAGG